MLLKQADAETGYFKARHEASPDLIESIATRNGYMSAQKVKEALEDGHRVYTSFSYYIRIS